MNNKSFRTTSVVLVIIVAVVAIYKFYPSETSESIPEATTSTQPQTETGAKNKEAQTRKDKNNSASKKTQTEVDPMKIDKRLTPIVLERLRLVEDIARKTNGPVEFYGKVLDQYGEPVVGARIPLELLADSETVLKKLLSGINNMGILINEENFVTYSDNEGKFSVHDRRGTSLRVVSIEKEGYLADKKGDIINFRPTRTRRHQPDAQNPKVYQLWKKGKPEPLLRIHGISERIKAENNRAGDKHFITMKKFDRRAKAYKDDTLFSSPIFYIQGVSEKVSEVREPPGTPKGRNWWIEIGFVDGGLQVTNDLFPYLAPETGYEQALRYEAKRGDPDWDYEVEQQIYFKHAGNYGTCKLKLGALDGGIRAECYRAYINPNGSRNLEPDKNKITVLRVRSEVRKHYEN